MTNNLDSVFSAFSDPTRRAVIERLTKGPAAVGALHADHSIALPTFMRHLKVLEDGGLITSKKNGRVRTVALCGETLDQAKNWISAQHNIWENRLDRLQALAELATSN